MTQVIRVLVFVLVLGEVVEETENVLETAVLNLCSSKRTQQFTYLSSQTQDKLRTDEKNFFLCTN